MLCLEHVVLILLGMYIMSLAIKVKAAYDPTNKSLKMTFKSTPAF